MYTSSRNGHVDAPVVLITGAGSGIGLACAHEFGSAGMALALTHFGEDAEINTVTQAYSDSVPGVLAARLDVSQRDHVQEFLDEVVATFGRIDVLVTCAGIHLCGPSEELDWQAWDQTLAVNLTGTFAVIRAALPTMLKQGHGRIITFASELGLTGREEDAAYCASKGAIISMTKALGREYAARGILVNCVAPGPVDTPMMRSSPEHDDPNLIGSMPIGRYGRPEELAKVVASLAGDAGTFFVGQILSPNGGAVI